MCLSIATFVLYNFFLQFRSYNFLHNNNNHHNNHLFQTIYNIHSVTFCTIGYLLHKAAVSLCVRVCVRACECACACACACVCECLPVRPSIRPSVCLYLSVFLYLFGFFPTFCNVCPLTTSKCLLGLEGLLFSPDESSYVCQ